MGVRFASLRHPNVCVMAPALTEAGQKQNFRLPPQSDSTPASPTGVIRNFLKNKNILNGHSVYNGEDIFKELDHDTTSKVNGYNTLREVLTTSVYRNLNKPICNISKTNLLNIIFQKTPCLKGGDFMMNSSDPSMGDQEGIMGLQKSSSSLEMTSSGSFLGEKRGLSEMEHLNLRSEITNDNGFTGVMSDDLLQAINSSLEANTADGEGLGSVAEGMFPGDLSSFERELLSDVDMMNMCVDVSESPVVIQSKEDLRKQKLEEVSKKQFELERKSEWLLRRLRKLQARTMGKHVADEIVGVLEHTHSLMKRVKSQEESADEHASSSTQTADTSFEDSESNSPRKRVSPAELSALFQELDSISHQQMPKPVNPARYFGSGPSEEPAPGPSNVPRFSESIRKELESVAGQLYTHLSIVERGMDSDVTASSSSESCDDEEGFPLQHQLPLSISKRAVWRSARDRAAIATRWTWLQAQIADLEYRIRQHSEAYRNIRDSKGMVLLEEATNPSQVVVNGYHGTLPGSSYKTDCLDSCSRTRPFLRTAFQKRRLLRLAGLHTLSKKAARPSTIRCKCLPPQVCAICTGRSDPLPQQVELLTVPEKIALLDPAFQPVLSLPSEVAQSIHFAAIMKTPDWQQRTLRSNVKTLKAVTSAQKLERSFPQERRIKKHIEHRRKYTSRIKKTVTSAITAKIKRKLSKGRKPKMIESDTLSHPLQRFRKRRRLDGAGNVATTYTMLADLGDDESLESITASSSKHGSPIPSPCPVIMKERTTDGHRRKRENSYDIDNIVIPYSMASSTRVEKLPYKEIPTPKWRVVDLEPSKTKLDLKNNGVVRSSQDSDAEDLNEDIIIQRHDRCELEEKKKFMSYIQFPLGRSRAHRRADSRTESSGANTPDPTSPNPIQQHDYETSSSPMASPPATPLSLTEGDFCYSQRKRTVSISRWSREESRCITPDYLLEIPPYEMRTFPLSDETYDKMLRVMPEGHPFNPFSITNKNEETKDLNYSRPGSPNTDSTESAIGEGEDPNDPEWTVDDERESERIKR